MELSEIRKLKEELEDNILDLLVKFEKETSLRVKEVILDRKPLNYGMYFSAPVINRIELICEV